MIGIGIIGSGQVTLQNHLPGIALCPDAHVVALCDADAATLQKASQSSGINAVYTDHRELLKRADVDAVIVATPNFTHEQIICDAADARKHILCEKPLSLDLAGAKRMLAAVEKAGVKHMTAFTYRFVPAMRYMKHLLDLGDIGQPYHFRAQRFQDWGARNLGWRQSKILAGTGEIGDMLSHRIDYGHMLLGPIKSVVADLRNFITTRGNKPADTDDWVAMLAQFQNDTTGVLESTKLATGRGEGLRGQDSVEINGRDGTIVYSTQKPLELQIGHRGDNDLHTIAVANEFMVYPGSTRDPTQGDPLKSFRYDQAVEFIDAIVQDRMASPSFVDGVRCQAVIEAALQSHESRSWAEVEQI